MCHRRLYGNKCTSEIIPISFCKMFNVQFGEGRRKLISGCFLIAMVTILVLINHIIIVLAIAFIFATILFVFATAVVIDIVYGGVVTIVASDATVAAVKRCACIVACIIFNWLT
ncbi:Hypothetical predicted protein [Octopus vulgaris]|uniref:Uncharacterized protein n=1 Tax=Octopus vulgaris TaxID=6645 RepID=A0AA36AVP5_OCTVU|nr:Hypothetical predicted protein [Octopus vulgaris]